MHNLIDKNSTFKMIVKRDQKAIDEEIDVLRFLAMDIRHPSDVSTLISYAEFVKQKLRRKNSEMSKPVKKYLEHLNDSYLRQCIEVENIIKKLTEQYVPNRMESA